MSTVQEALKDPSTSNLLAPLDLANDQRFQNLDKCEAYYRGTAYEDREYPWNVDPTQYIGQGGVPMPGMPGYISVDQRKPSTPYHLSRVIVDRFVALLFGEHRFPKVRVPGYRNTEDWADALSGMLKASFMEAATLGGATGSVIVSIKIVDGRFRLESLNSKWCTVVWKDYHAAEMQAFRMMYPYPAPQYDKEKKQWELKWFLYRRIVTPDWDIQFQPQELINDGQTLKLKNEDEQPVPDEEKSVEHKLGFVPAVFIQNIPRYETIDGDPTCAGAYDLIDRINEILSAVNNAVHGNVDPTLVMRISPEDRAKLNASGGVIKRGKEGFAITVGSDGDAKYLEITGESIKVALEVLEKLRTFVLELCQCVIADPHRITGAAQSAAAITKLYAHMLAKADVLRNQYGEKGLKKIVAMMIRCVKVKHLFENDKGELVQGVFIPPKKFDADKNKVVELHPDTEVTEDDIFLEWGEYFEPMVQDIFQAAEAASLAVGGAAITTTEVAAKFLARFFKDPDPNNTIKLLEQLQQQQQEHELELAKAGASAKSKSPAQSKPKVKPQPTDGGGDDE